MSAAREVAGVGVAESPDPHGLRGHMGVLELIFTVVAYNGPVVVFLGFIPAMILLGNGVGTPVAILVCGVVIVLVAVGLVKMASRLDKPGGFYAIITAGLGRIPGLSAGFVALACYFAALISVYALGGIALGGLVQTLFNGPDIPWIMYSFAMAILASVLGYFNINASAKVLTVVLGAELVLMIVYVVAVLIQGGADGIQFDSFSPENVISGSPAIALLFGIGLFGGFEATVIFRDEVKNPRRTIPVATYGVIALLAGLYALVAWMFINAYGANVIVDIVTKNLAGAAPESVEQYVGTVAYDIATIMLFTSSFALVLAAHNITSRYLFNLSADGIFPRALGKAHPRHVSPHRASIVVSVASVLTLLLFLVVQFPKELLYGMLAGTYSYAFVLLLVLVSLAIAFFLVRDRSHTRATAAVVMAAAAFIILGITLVLATQNFSLLTGASGALQVVLLSVVWGAGLVGAIVAAVLRVRRPEVYARIGRQ